MNSVKNCRCSSKFSDIGTCTFLPVFICLKKITLFRISTFFHSNVAQSPNRWPVK